MPPRKRKTDVQPKLEEIVDDDVKVLKSKAGQNDKAKVETKKEAAAGSKEEEDDDGDMFAKRRAKMTGVSSPAKKKQATAPAEPEHGSSDSGIWVNRAPVLTLWVSVVAQQQGFSKEAGDHLGIPGLHLCCACCYGTMQNVQLLSVSIRKKTEDTTHNGQLHPIIDERGPVPYSLSVTSKRKQIVHVQGVRLARRLQASWLTARGAALASMRTRKRTKRQRARRLRMKRRNG